MEQFPATTKFAMFVILVLFMVSPQIAQISKYDKVNQTKLGKTGSTSNSGGKIVFSKNPIDAENPINISNNFSAGDNIYALIQVEEPWNEIKKIGSSDKKEAKIPLVMLIDEERLFQYITIKNQEIVKGKSLLLDIAPEADKMKTYSDPQILYPDAYGSKWGPATFTDKFSQLSAGAHSIKIEVQSYGRVYATGEFTISGNDYSSYASLFEKIKNVITNNRTMPTAGMTNAALESEMMKLCKNSGLKNIKKLIIIDKDWWIDRISGGDSPINSRHLAAAVGIKESDGSCYYKTVTFHQYKLINGNFGPLEFTNASDKVVLPASSF